MLGSRHVASSALVLLVPSLACGSPQTTPPSAVTVDVSASASAAPASVDAGRTLPPDVGDLVAVVAPPGACFVDAHPWRGELALRVAADGPPFATLRTARSVRLTLHEAGGAFVTAETGSAQVSGFVAVDTANLGTRTSVAFGGFYIPDPTGRLPGSVHIAGDRVTLSVDTPAGIELVGATALQADVACTDLSLQGPSLDVRSLLDESGGHKRARLVARKKTTLYVSATAPPAARIIVGAEAPLVSVLEQALGRTLIGWASDDGVIFGWVATGDLRPGTETRQDAKLAALREASQFGMIGLLGTDAEAATGPPSEAPGGGERVACAQPARVVAEVGGHRYAVGRIDIAAPLSVHRSDGPVSPLDPPGSLEVAQGAALVVPSRDIFSCGATTAIEAADPDDGSAPFARPAATGGAGGTPGPSLRQGATSVNGRMPPEVIQRIVRQNFGRFRLCYEAGLRKNPRLQGRVTTKFVIDASGSVATATDAGSDLPDPGVVACVVRSFGGLSFPQPEGGTATVTFPVIFSPGS
jgi:hypothetical protein